MNHTRNEKIARLPDQIREQVNLRLHDHEPGETILQWLNSQPKTKKHLRASELLLQTVPGFCAKTSPAPAASRARASHPKSDAQHHTLGGTQRRNSQRSGPGAPKLRAKAGSSPVKPSQAQ